MNLSLNCIAIAAMRAISRKELAHYGSRPRNSLRSGYASQSTSRGKNVLILIVIDRAIAAIECELKIVEMEVEHPERFVHQERHGPFAKWNGSIAELLELVIPVLYAGKLAKPTGEPMVYSDVITLIEMTF